MPTVDLRTRPNRDDLVVDPAMFVYDIAPALIAVNGTAAARAAEQWSLPSFTLQVGDDAVTFEASGSQMAVRRGGGAPLAVAVDLAGFSDLVQDASSTFGAYKMGRARVVEGNFDHFLGWEPVLRCLLDGRAVHQAGDVTFRDRNGAPLDLRRSFNPLHDDPADIAHFLAEAGFLHLEQVFTEDEMAAVSAELDEAVAAATPDDGSSWWARTNSGEHYPARILGFNRKSPTLRELVRSPRFTMIGTLTDDQWVQRSPDAEGAAEGLLKKIGVIEGISDVSWHKDCSMGGHSRSCCGLTVGISVTGAGRENGELGVVAGSHRANVAPLGLDDGLDLPRLALPTRTGDITVHCSCTLHMSRPPVSAERRVAYTGFSLAPRAIDAVQQLSDEEIRARRAALSGRAAGADAQGGSSRLANFDL